jgi:quercetin dioxygenase-like cupin family protein
MTTAPLAGWEINPDGGGDWLDWGDGGRARARILASGDGYLFVLVEADTGYVGTPHEHTDPEFAYVLSGRVRNQGQVMEAGGAYVAATGSHHTDFEALEPSVYVIIFRL